MKRPTLPKCEICHRPYYRWGKDTTCTVKCARVLQKQELVKKYGPDYLKKTCVQCNTVFVSSKFSQKTCNKECRKIYAKAKAGQAIKRHWEKVLLGESSGLYMTLRFEILKRDDFKCTYCGYGAADGRKLHVDHVLPRVRGGKNEASNLVTACLECNLGKGDVLLEDRQIRKQTVTKKGG